MVVSEDSKLVEFDADAALAAARKVDSEGIRLCVEYTPEEFHTLYADDVTMALYGTHEEMSEHFEEVHSYVHVDFTEKDLFSEIFRGAGEVRSFVTYMDHVVLLRFIEDQQGLFLSADPNADVTTFVEAVENEIYD
jgi:hypothetical protein